MCVLIRICVDAGCLIFPTCLISTAPRPSFVIDKHNGKESINLQHSNLSISEGGSLREVAYPGEYDYPTSNAFMDTPEVDDRIQVHSAVMSHFHLASHRFQIAILVADEKDPISLHVCCLYCSLVPGTKSLCIVRSTWKLCRRSLEARNIAP